MTCKYASCTGLTTVIIPNSVTNISNSTFFGCSGLTSITVESNNPKYDSRNNCNAIIETSSNTLCFGCKSTNIPNSVTSIGNGAFRDSNSLTSVTIPNSVTSIGDYAFDGCSGLTSITIPNSVMSIGDYTFSNCTGLTSNTIPNSVTSIGDYAFKGCSGLTSVTIPNSVTSISNSVFSGCSGLTSVSINSNAIVSYNYGYSSNSGLKSIFGSQVTEYILGDSVTSIGNNAFNGCSGLTSVTIPNSVTSIGYWAFNDCSGLSSITIPNSVTSISISAFARCSGLTSVIIPNSVTSIGSYAFFNCSGLTFVTIPNSVTSISDWAFYGCSSLTSITIPNSVTSIGDDAFAFCRGLTSVIIPNSVTSIGNHAFYYCSGLTSVTIPNSVTIIGNDAFFDCNSLTYVTLESNTFVSASKTSSTSMKSIFGSQVNEYIIGDEVESIGEYAFYDCYGVTSVTIGNNVTGIGEYAFYGCQNANYFVNRGTDGLLSVWNYGADPYEIGTSQRLARPFVSVVSKTQTSIGYRISNKYSELEYSVTKGESTGNNEYLITELTPEYNFNIGLTVRSANNSYSTSTDVTTLPISPTVFAKNNSPTTITVMGSYTKGDAKVVYQRLEFLGRTIEGDGKTITIKGLEPYSNYPATYTVGVAYGDNDQYIKMYTGTATVSTSPLSLITQQPKVISAGNVIVAAVSNLEDEDAIVGFEWRRTDWPDDFESNIGVAYLYEGKMEGYIRNLYTEKLWRYRPYFESSFGSRYYGDWVGIDPTNTSYFEPTVHTYATITVTGNRAEVKGYVMRGTDRVTSQGFMYWKDISSYSLRKKAASVPAGATIVEATGNIMNAVFEDLDYETEYCYVAFVKTEENEMFYGEVQKFSTNVDPDGIEEVHSSESIVHSDNEWYDLNGRKLSKAQKGINIIRMNDGTTKKVMIK